MSKNNRFNSINIYDSNLLNEFGFNKSTEDFLTTIGLPKDSPPYLTFVKNNDIQYEGMLKITDYFDYLDSGFEKYIVIGSNGEGDQIVIDNEDNCKIKLLDHENNFFEEFVNSSIEKLNHSLTIYENFIDTIINELGENAYFDFKYTNSHINLLKAQLLNNDPESINSNTFWDSEIVTLIANRDWENNQ